MIKPATASTTTAPAAISATVRRGRDPLGAVGVAPDGRRRGTGVRAAAGVRARAGEAPDDLAASLAPAMPSWDSAAIATGRPTVGVPERAGRAPAAPAN